MPLFQPPSCFFFFLSIFLQTGAPPTLPENITIRSKFYNTTSLNTTTIMYLGSWPERWQTKTSRVGLRLKCHRMELKIKLSSLKFQQFKQSLDRISAAIFCSVGIQWRVMREISYAMAWSQSSRLLWKNIVNIYIMIIRIYREIMMKMRYEAFQVFEIR